VDKVRLILEKFVWVESRKIAKEKSENDAMRTLLRPAQGMLLKGDEGGAKFGGGVAENGDFRQGSHYPWVILGGRRASAPAFSGDCSRHGGLPDEAVSLITS
jgi:hypothetical protein